MEDRAKPGFTEEIAAAIDWWRDAGVDCHFNDEPANWLAPAATLPTRPGGGLNRPGASPANLRGEAEVPPAPEKPTFSRSDWPQDLAAFTQWWLSDPLLDDGRTTGRVPPRGCQGAEFMVIVPDPERDDDDSLLAGPQGKLLDAMLAAMAIAPDQVYIASVLPRHMPMADWPALAEKGFGALLCHHVKLAAPRRLIALGSNILPLLGNDPAHNPAVLRSFNQEGVTLPLLAGKGLAALLERPRWKAGLWQAWLDWTPD